MTDPNLHRHEYTFLSLQDTVADKRFNCAYHKTYDFSGPYINDDHRNLCIRLAPSGMIDYGIEGWLLPADAWKLYEMAFFSDGNIFELGTYRGLSAAIMASALASSGGSRQIISVDLDPHSPELGAANLRDRSGGESVHFFVVEGTQAIVDQASAKEQYGFAFIDHSHRYEHVAASCKQLHRIVKIGGFALFHDFNDPRNASKDAPEYGVYQGVMDGLDPRLWEPWGIFGCSGLFRRIGFW